MSKSDSGHVFYVEDADSLLGSLEKGMALKGRVIEDLGAGRYILRIRGYNLVMESDRRFSIGQETDLTVKAVSPRLMLSPASARRSSIVDPERGKADIIV